MNNIKARLRKLEVDLGDWDALQERLTDIWLNSLTDAELEAYVRDSAQFFRNGNFSPERIENFSKMAKLDEVGGFDNWLQSVKPPQLGDDELLRSVARKYEAVFRRKFIG